MSVKKKPYYKITFRGNNKINDRVYRLLQTNCTFQ